MLVSHCINASCSQVLHHYTEYLEAHGKAELAATALTSLQWDEGFDLEGLPDIATAEMPLPVSSLKVPILTSLYSKCEA